VFFEFLLLLPIRFGGNGRRCFTECHSDGPHEDADTLRTSLDTGPLFDTGCRFLGGRDWNSLIMELRCCAGSLAG
jgi:hypothetical protein